jgi:hypothetical protein
MLTNMADLTKHVKLRIVFNKPTLISFNRLRYREVTEAVIGRIFHCGIGFGYSTRHEKVRRGKSVEWGGSIAYYEPVIDKSHKNEGFKSLEAFARKFDPRFITPKAIEELYNGTSSQTGLKYTPADFHQLGPQGKRVLESFLRGFISLDVEGLRYREGYTKGTKHFDAWHKTNRHPGRDISISHTLGQPYIHYASEFCGCGNGRYGLLANESTFLHLEDD